MPVSSKEFLDIQATIECGFTLKRVRDMIRTYSGMVILLEYVIVIRKYCSLGAIAPPPPPLRRGEGTGFWKSMKSRGNLKFQNQRGQGGLVGEKEGGKGNF